VNVAEIASHFHGGGHAKAAGLLSNLSPNKFKAEIVSLIDEAMNK
jgi:nanoRNase/pAp phosphatase (c-di-AMP/oligoRNAs hydrolase)